MTQVLRKKSECSFTLLETIIALGILTTVILRLVGSQGNIVYFSTYTKKLTQATWLAKRIMSQVEYHWQIKDFGDLEGIDEKDRRFEDENDPDFDFTYDLSIQEWDFPVLDFLAGGGISGDEEGGESNANKEAEGGMIKSLLDQVLGGEVLKIAHVEVYWPEGAKRNSTTLSYLLTNQRKVDQELLKMEGTYNNLLKKIEDEENPPRRTTGRRGNRGGGTIPATSQRDCEQRNGRWDGTRCFPKGTDSEGHDGQGDDDDN